MSRDMQNFNKLEPDHQLRIVANVIKNSPKEDHERLIEEFVIRRNDQQVVRDLLKEKK